MTWREKLVTAREGRLVSYHNNRDGHAVDFRPVTVWSSPNVVFPHDVREVEWTGTLVVKCQSSGGWTPGGSNQSSVEVKAIAHLVDETKWENCLLTVEIDGEKASILVHARVEEDPAVRQQRENARLAAQKERQEHLARIVDRMNGLDTDALVSTLSQKERGRLMRIRSGEQYASELVAKIVGGDYATHEYHGLLQARNRVVARLRESAANYKRS